MKKQSIKSLLLVLITLVLCFSFVSCGDDDDDTSSAVSSKEIVSSKEPDVSSKEPAVSSKAPAVSSKEPVVSSKEPAVSSETSSEADIPPATGLDIDEDKLVEDDLKEE